MGIRNLSRGKREVNPFLSHNPAWGFVTSRAVERGYFAVVS